MLQLRDEHHSRRGNSVVVLGTGSKKTQQHLTPTIKEQILGENLGWIETFVTLPTSPLLMVLGAGCFGDLAPGSRLQYAQVLLKELVEQAESGYLACDTTLHESDFNLLHHLSPKSWSCRSCEQIISFRSLNLTRCFSWRSETTLQEQASVRNA
jgi:hypothetical protein